ncbi:hypothetical protein F4819DRAFT_386069 [Hypoxylon fuscum]|nr:hypothetical protein F4819DRAFT_386069 [Hypoxylon fuscum]
MGSRSTRSTRNNRSSQSSSPCTSGIPSPKGPASGIAKIDLPHASKVRKRRPWVQRVKKLPQGVPRVNIRLENGPFGRLHSIFDMLERKYIFHYEQDAHKLISMTFLDGKVRKLEDSVTGEIIYEYKRIPMQQT